MYIFCTCVCEFPTSHASSRFSIFNHFFFDVIHWTSMFDQLYVTEGRLIYPQTERDERHGMFEW